MMAQGRYSLGTTGLHEPAFPVKQGHVFEELLQVMYTYICNYRSSVRIMIWYSISCAH
jgi:hypothetical protein